MTLSSEDYCSVIHCFASPLDGKMQFDNEGSMALMLHICEHHDAKDVNFTKI